MAKLEYKGARVETVRIFFRYLPLILSIVILSTGISIVNSLTKDDYYDGHLQLMVTPKSDHIELVRASRYQTTISSTELMLTESEFLQSWPLLQNAASRVDSSWQRVFQFEPGKSTQLITKLRNKLWVNPVRNSTMLEVGFTDGDPIRLANFLNTLAEQYILARTNVAVDTSSILYYTDKIEFVNTELDSLQQLRIDVLTENNLVNPEIEMPAHLQRNDQIVTENNDLDRQINQKTDLLVRLQSVLDDFVERDILIVPISSIGSIESLKSLYYDKQRHLNSLQQKYQDDYFEISRVTEELALLKSQIVLELRGVLSYETSNRQILIDQRQRNRLISNELGDVLEAYPRIVAYIDQLQLEISSRKKMLGILTDKLSEYQLANPSFDANVDVVIVEPAIVQSSPSGPRRVLSVVITLILSLVVSVLLTFLIDLVSNRYNSTYQLIMDLDLPVIVSIPESEEV